MTHINPLMFTCKSISTKDFNDKRTCCNIESMVYESFSGRRQCNELTQRFLPLPHDNGRLWSQTRLYLAFGTMIPPYDKLNPLWSSCM